jgi:hypothetical protein
MSTGLQPNNPFTIFLIFILLLLSSSPGIQEKLAFLKSFLFTTQQTAHILQSGWQIWQAGMSRLFPQK